MAALRFQIHVDKENAGSVGVNPKLRNGSSSGIRGKVFKDTGTPGLIKPRKALGDVNTPASSRPRKALGDINGTHEQVLKGKSGLKPLSSNPHNFKKPEQKKQQEKSIKKQEPKISVQTAPTASRTAQVFEFEEIEQMHNERDPDDDEDIWPSRERLSTYIDKLISWRPPCLFGTGNASDDEEEDRKIQEIMGQLDALPEPNLSKLEEPFPLAESLLVPQPYDDIPFADITLESLQCVTPPSLEDSYSFEPDLGKLVLKDDI